MRRYIALTTFGFYKGGILNVTLTNFKVDPLDENALVSKWERHQILEAFLIRNLCLVARVEVPKFFNVFLALQFGFSLDRTLSDAMNPYLDSHQEKCLLQGVTGPKSELEPKDDGSVIYFIMDLKNLTWVSIQRRKNRFYCFGRDFYFFLLFYFRLRVHCSLNVRSVHIYKDSVNLSLLRQKRGSASTRFSDTALFPRKRRDVAPHGMNLWISHRSTNFLTTFCPIFLQTQKFWVEDKFSRRTDLLWDRIVFLPISDKFEWKSKET